MIEPLVSVIVPTHNRIHSLPYALASVRAQTYQNWECIVIDDGSNDGTSEFLDQLRDPRFRTATHQRNLGEPAARQHGLELAKGDLLGGVDADDWLYPGALSRQVLGFDSQDIVAVAQPTCALLNREFVGTIPTEPPGVYQFNTLRRVRFPLCGWMIRAKVAKQLRYDESLLRGCDLDFALHLLYGRSYRVLPEVGYAYSVESGFGLKQNLVGHRFTSKIFAKWLGVAPVRACTLILESYLKYALFTLLGTLGLWEKVTNRRVVSPSQKAITRHQAAEKRVLSYLREMVS